jgi:hypothetical protein
METHITSMDEIKQKINGLNQIRGKTVTEEKLSE